MHVQSKITLLKVIAELATLGGPVIVTREFATGLAIQMTTFMAVQVSRGKSDKNVDEIIAEGRNFVFRLFVCLIVCLIVMRGDRDK